MPSPEPAFGSPESETAPGTPWERRAELGLFTAWWQTVYQSLFEPGKLFTSARLDRGRAQLGFAVTTWSVFAALGQIIDRLLLSDQRDQATRWLNQLRQAGAHLPPFVDRLLAMGNNDNSIPATFGIALLSPLFAFLFVYLNAGVTHGSAMLIGQARRGFAATFAACAYGFAPFVLLAVPGCGGIVALVWCAALTGYGLKRMHRISPGAAAGAVLAPYVILCCAGCAVSLSVASFFGGMIPK